MKELDDTLEPAAAHKEDPRGQRLMVLSLTALGVVYGDIGTSPLYAIRECFKGSHPIALSPSNVLGVLSLIVWALIVVISVKYLLYVMRADNRGEGGILALMALVHPGERSRRFNQWLLVALGLFGAALLYGDGTITPAISVLSAIEGLEVATPAFTPYVIPVTIVILVGLFLFQRRGTAGVGAVFGPIMLVWFGVLGVLGIVGILHHPDVFRAFNPVYGLEFFQRNGWTGFAVLGAVFLVVTGGEALYADMGHFGRGPIRLAWFTVVLPGLLLNYFGQGALLLQHPHLIRNPFYLLAPDWALYPLVGLATIATVIASQAVISGAFSLTRQAIQLGYCPRMEIRHTSSREIGQIYMPTVNWTLMIVTTALVIGFQRSGNLAAAYGVAVTTTMVITTLLAFVIARTLWKWSLAAALAVSAFFLVPDLAFFGANMTKIWQGGWFPLLVGFLIYTMMSTWRKGRRIVVRRLQNRQLPLKTFISDLEADPPPRVEGSAVFLTGMMDGTPSALVHHLKHNKMLHEQVVILTVVNRSVPVVPASERVELTDMGFGFYRLVAAYGFIQEANIPEILRRCRPLGLDINLEDASFYLGREILIPTPQRGMALWREKLFAFMSRNSQRPTNFFHLPHNRVIELGVEVEL